MSGSKYQVEFCRTVKRAMVACTAFPQVDGKSARQLLDFLSRRHEGDGDGGSHPKEGEGGLDQEISEYTSILSNRQNLKTVFVFFLVHLLVVVKYLYHAFVLRSELGDFKQIVGVLETETTKNRSPLSIDGADKNKSGNRPPEVIVKFLCLLTNCTRLSPDNVQPEDLASVPGRDRLADDLEYLPVFGLCHPTLRRFYEPTADLGSLVILLDYYISLLIVCTCIIFPIQQLLLNRANDESLLYILAPNITVELLREQLERIYQSQLGPANQKRLYYSACAFREQHMSPLSSPADMVGNPRYLCNNNPGPLESHRRAPDESDSALRTDGLSHKRFISSCLPAVRTPWWREKIAKLYCANFVFETLCINLPIAILLLYIVIHKTCTLKARLVAYDEFMAQEHCALWLRGASEQRMTVKLAEYSLGWTLWDVIATATPITCSAYLFVVLSSHIVIVIGELTCWLREQRHDLLMLMEILRVRPLVLQERAQSTQHTQRHHGVRLGGLAILRDLFAEHTSIRFGFVYSAPLGTLKSRKSHPEIGILREQLARAMLLSGRRVGHELVASTRRCLVELAEKVYLNHQLFMRLFDLYSTKIAALILMQNFSLYGTIVISVLLSKTSPDVLWLSYLLNAVFISIIIVFIWIVSKFHAESRKLQPLFWSLIARLRDYESAADVELGHLRRLFTKQTVHLDRVGGLAISAFGFRVTYTNVITIIAWSSTIVALYLKDR